MKLEELKQREPFGENWVVDSRAGKNCYNVHNTSGIEAEMRLIPSYDGCFEELKKLQKIGVESDTSAEIFSFGSFEEMSFNEAETDGDSTTLEHGADKLMYIYVISEKLQGIEEFFDKTAPTSKMITQLAQDIASALMCYERENICHGVISYSSIGVKNGRYKLIYSGIKNLDFIDYTMSRKEYKYYYFAAPEVLKGDFGIKGDIYSLGLVLYSLFNFKRLPFMPSKNERYMLPENAELKAFNKRISNPNEKFAAPLYADESFASIISRCCSFNENERYSSIASLVEDISNVNAENRVIEYPNFLSVGSVDKKQNDFQEVYTPKADNPVTSAVADDNDNKKSDDDELIYTMGAQAYYTQAMANIRSNRHVKVDENLLNKIDEVGKRISDKYGFESNEFIKFAQKVKDYENLKDIVGGLQRDNNRRKNIIKGLIGVGAAAVIAVVILLFKTNTFYVNQGNYNYIYQKNLLDTVECFKTVSCNNLIKDGNRLYYIDLSNNQIFSTSARNGEDDVQVTEDTAKHFKIKGDYIYYINLSDSNKLYRINKDGTDNKCIYDEPCVSLTVEKKNIKFSLESNPAEYLLFDTKTEEIKNAIIK